ncbi:glutaredoxin family protein [Actinomyces sp. MRS3W]|uniref:glutaredoxin family protein n=1 Tax=Actinomyces sp. MRS3W TaxID=2800796 RepID=UPI0028FDB961|nr:glutaredoxin domain-containing protein [Actinomyces sp. MRS3W]MDU0348311.1 glutaredoxin domain-containing protein [Actinomyces sp. MRS3W]
MGTNDSRAPWLDIYTIPSCPQCAQTLRLLDRLGARHRARPLADHPDAQALAAEHHVTSAPVVVAMSPVGLVAGVWGGHRPDLIRRHLDEYAPSVWDEPEETAS